MIRIILFLLLIFNLLSSSLTANTKLYINTKVNNEIITNYDIEKEGNYLKKLNPDLINLEEKKIFKIAKESLINEKIKESVIINESKIQNYNLDEDEEVIEQILRDFYTQLNFQNKEDFIRSLKNEKEYKIDEIKQKLKIEFFWNKLIYTKYRNQIKINKPDLMKKIDKFENEEIKEYFVSEIVFRKDKDKDINEKINQIKLSINEIGFSNTANTYSISETSKFGGQVGWINLNNYSETVQNSLRNKKEGDLTNVIQVGNNYIFIKVKEIRTKKFQIDKEAELDKLINFETNNQLNRFSKIFFDKSKINYTINEK